ncbi:hypothetical protein ACIRVF_39330 [Kitasatospora sp. NPDC101157]|uniref:hypothetical protein n=1 Tax=Kitasatospora sp. NPDC101157 TaxID=3364098 RepID=UPI0038239D6A
MVFAMRITITIEDPTPEALEQLLALAALPEATISAVPADRWTPERAFDYYELLPPRAKQILRAVVESDGRCDADVVKEDGKNLRGTTGAFRRVLNDGVRARRWPAALPVPVESVIVGGQLLFFDLIRQEPDPLLAFREALKSDGRPR